MATEEMMMFPIWSLVRCSSSRTTAIKGETPNHPKKHRKNANHVKWNVRIWMVFRLKSWMEVALAFDAFMGKRLVENRGKESGKDVSGLYFQKLAKNRNAALIQVQVSSLSYPDDRSWFSIIGEQCTGFIPASISPVLPDSIAGKHLPTLP
jgi:hypothetical protein